MLRRLKVTIEYHGVNFVGWQRQENGISIQQKLEEAIFKFSQENVKVYGAGRTDAGVHALGQVAHFDLTKDIITTKIMDAMNFHLKPHPISILQIEEVPQDFHARFSAKQRSYIYKLINRKAPLSLLDTLAWHVIKPLNVIKMQLAAQFLIGKYDFSSFRSVSCQSLSSIKSIDNIEISRSTSCIEIKISAPSFLHNQVRIIVGTLVKIGKEEWEVERMKTILDAKDRTKAGSTAPPYGLYFLEVKY